MPVLPDSFIIHLSSEATVRLLIKVNANVASGLPVRTAWFIAKRYRVLPTLVRYRSIKKVKSTFITLVRDVICEMTFVVY